MVIFTRFVGKDAVSRDGDRPRCREYELERRHALPTVDDPLFRYVTGSGEQSFVDDRGKEVRTPARDAVWRGQSSGGGRMDNVRPQWPPVVHLGPVEPVDAGGLDDSWRQQPGTPASGRAMDAVHLRAGLAGQG